MFSRRARCLTDDRGVCRGWLGVMSGGAAAQQSSLSPPRQPISVCLGLAGITAEVPTQSHSLAALALGEYRPRRAPGQFEHIIRLE